VICPLCNKDHDDSEGLERIWIASRPDSQRPMCVRCGSTLWKRPDGTVGRIVTCEDFPTPKGSLADSPLYRKFDLQQPPRTKACPGSWDPDECTCKEKL
jgi:hypothetical protein